MFYQKMTNFCSWVYVCLNWIIFVHYNITQAIGKVTSEQVWRSSSTWVHYVILHIDFTFSMAFVCGLDNCKLRLTLCNFVCVKVNLLTYNFSLRNSNLWFFVFIYRQHYYHQIVIYSHATFWPFSMVLFELGVKTCKMFLWLILRGNKTRPKKLRDRSIIVEPCVLFNTHQFLHLLFENIFLTSRSDASCPVSLTEPKNLHYENFNWHFSDI